MPDTRPSALPADIAALLEDADYDTVPTEDPNTGPADDEDVEQTPDYEEPDVPDSDADTSLADPAVEEV